MKYSEIMDIVYQSDEVAHIPLELEESVPFRCEINGKKAHSFFYWDHRDVIKIILMLSVFEDDNSVILLTADKIVEVFQLNTLIFEAPSIKNIDAYNSDRDLYISNYEKMCDDFSAIERYGYEEYELLKKLVGNELFENVFKVIAADYLHSLIQGDLDKNENYDREQDIIDEEM